MSNVKLAAALAAALFVSAPVYAQTATSCQAQVASGGDGADRSTTRYASGGDGADRSTTRYASGGDGADRSTTRYAAADTGPSAPSAKPLVKSGDGCN